MVKKQIWDILFKVLRKSYDIEYFEFKNLNNEGKLLKFQNESLRNLLFQAYKNVPFYTHVFDEIGIVKNSNSIDLSKFNEIPILTKDIIRKNHRTLISKDYEERGWYHYSSGGSTGEPLRIIKDIRYYKRAKATGKYYEDMIGINDNNPKTIRLWGSAQNLFNGGWDIKGRVQNWFTNTKLLNTFRLTENNMEKYIKTINSFKPELIVGYAGSLYELCRYAEKEKYTIFTPKIIISAAEPLRDDMRQKIERVFGTKLYNFYGSTEVGALASECKYGSMHIFSFFNLIEILDGNDRPVKENEEGRVIVTNLHNYSMPLIRYGIGDMAVLGPKRCKCGNPLPTLKKITGRTIEHFIKEDGSFIPTEFLIYLFTVYYNKGTIEKFQIIQEDYKKIKILVVPIGNIIESEKRDIEDKIKVVMGEDMKIIWEFVDDIPEPKSGKHVYIKSKVQK